MQRSVDDLVENADWKELTPRLLNYGDMLIRKCPWRGIPVTAQPGSMLCVEGHGADDFLQEAVDRLMTNRRVYDHSISLEQNLRRAIRSMIWSVNKSSRRSPLTELKRTSDESVDPIQHLPSDDASADVTAIVTEEAAEQRQRLAEFEKSLANEPQLLSVIAAYKDGHYKPREIEKRTGLAASRISELKRKLRDRMERFETELRQGQSR